MAHVPDEDAESTYIARILDAPADALTRLEYADALRRAGDPRAVYLKLEIDWARSRETSALLELQAAGSALNPVWVARVSRPPVGVCCDHVRFEEGVRDRMRPTVREEDLVWLESRFQVALPPDYRAFLLNWNGGVAEPHHLRLTAEQREAGCNEIITEFCSLWAPRESGIDWDMDLVWRLQELEEFRAAGQNVEELSPVWRRDEAERWRGSPHSTWMIIGSGAPTGGLEWFCLECHGESPAKVYCVNPCMDSPDDLDYCLMAPTFSVFLGMLTESQAPQTA
jgi:uncharacterized protein (TIGR02996 family)